MLHRCYSYIAKEEKNESAQSLVKLSSLYLGQESGELLMQRIRKRIQTVKTDSSCNSLDLIPRHLPLIWVQVAGAVFFGKTQNPLFPFTSTRSSGGTSRHSQVSQETVSPACPGSALGPPLRCLKHLPSELSRRPPNQFI